MENYRNNYWLVLLIILANIITAVSAWTLGAWLISISHEVFGGLLLLTPFVYHFNYASR